MNLVVGATGGCLRGASRAGEAGTGDGARDLGSGEGAVAGGTRR